MLQCNINHMQSTIWNGIQTDITLNSFSRKKAAWSLLVQINFVFRFGAPNKRLGLIMNSDGDGSSYGRSSKLIGVLKKLGTSVRWSTCMFVYISIYMFLYLVCSLYICHICHVLVTYIWFKGSYNQIKSEIQS